MERTITLRITFPEPKPITNMITVSLEGPQWAEMLREWLTLNLAQIKKDNHQ